MTRLFVYIVVLGESLLLASCLTAQTSYMPIGAVANVTHLQSCPSMRGFVSGGTCYSASVTACAGDQDLPLVFNVLPAQGQLNGTIVLFSGFGGTNAIEPPGDEDSYVTSYTGKGYQVIQLAWGPTTGGIDWEYSNINTPSLNYNIRNAACRPATFLWYVYSNWYTVGGGMCAHGFSAGAGALAYAIAWYGAADQNRTGQIGYLDKVELLSGPELADLEQGCQINSSGMNTDFRNICLSGHDGCPTSGQPGAWSSSLEPPPPGYPLEFSPRAATGVEAWSGGTYNTGPACANNMTQTTYDSSWLNMSIVSPVQNGLPSYYYPKTSIAAWLCESTTVATNNSESQGDLFYDQLSFSDVVSNQLAVNAVIGCPRDPENVDGGTWSNTSTQGFGAIVADMTDKNHGCVKHH